MSAPFSFWVYIMTNLTHSVLYIGVTNHLPRRVAQHQKQTGKGFTKTYKVNKLVYAEQYQYIDQAIAREKKLKTWRREWKLQLIEKNNPHWEDITSTINMPISAGGVA
jgi:putative endonuclease